MIGSEWEVPPLVGWLNRLWVLKKEKKKLVEKDVEVKTAGTASTPQPSATTDIAVQLCSIQVDESEWWTGLHLGLPRGLFDSKNSAGAVLREAERALAEAERVQRQQAAEERARTSGRVWRAQCVPLRR